MVRIPSEYQEVEYLESTGTQFINLPFGFLDTDEVEIVAAEHTRGADRYMVCASVWNNDNNRFAMVGGLYNKFRVGFGPAGTAFPMSPDVDSDTLIHKWVYADRLFTIDDGLSMYDVSRKNFGTETANLKLFYGYASNNKGKIAYYHHKKANGTEINLIPCYRKSDNEPGMYDTVSKTFFTNSGTGTFLVGNDVNYSNTNLLEVRRRILLNTPHVESMSGNPAIFSTDIAANLKECKIRFTPVQAGEGTPSPENVRPISGWDGVSVTRCGKNLFDYTNPDNWYVAESPTLRKKSSTIGSISIENDAVNLSRKNTLAGLVLILGYLHANRTYTFSGLTTRTDNKAYIAKIDGSLSDQYTSTRLFTIIFVNNSVTFTPTKDGVYEILLWGTTTATITLQNAQLELGSTATPYEPTPYEPYTETSISIPFPQTIFGGYVDLIKGEIVEEWNCIEIPKISGISKSNSTTEPWAHRFTLKHWNSKVGRYEKVNGIANMICDVAVADGIGRTNYTMQGVSNTVDTYFYDNTISTVAEFKEKYANHYLAYPIVKACQTTYPLTPQSIKALKGLNNLYSDANGNIEVKFWKH